MRIRLTVTAALATLLATVGLYPLFESAGWFTTGLGAVLSVAAAGLLTRRLRLPVLVCLTAGPLALLVYLTASFTPDRALLWVVPTPGSLSALGGLVRDGWHEANAYAAPVPMLRGIDLICAIGIGTVACLVDFLAVRLRRAAPAGLPLLAMYSVPAAVRQESVSWLVFLIGAAGYLALLVVDGRERLAGWGRPVFTRHWTANQSIREGPDSRQLAVNGRRIGSTALLIAIVLPLAVPGIQPKGLFGIGGDGGHGGITTVTTPDPLVSLKRQLVRSDDAVVLRYRTTDDPSPDYLRMYSLDRFDGEAWTYTSMHADKRARVADAKLPEAPGLGVTTVRMVTTKIEVDPQVRGMHVLPAPYPPTKVDIGGDWRVDAPTLMIFSLHDSAGGRSYTVTSTRPEPTYQQLETTAPLPDDITAHYLAVPDSVPPDVAKLAHRITSAATTPYERAIKLQEWFTEPGNFTYSLDAPSPRNVGALHDFLFHSRTGYCEQFAASMALLARIVGIPARVGMGYTAGSRRPDGTWVVRTRDAHAWPELYFTGVGWLRFEPTPAGGGGQGSATVPGYSMPQVVTGTTGDGTQNSLPQGGAGTTGGTGPGPLATPRHRSDSIENGGAGGPIPAPARSRLPIGLLMTALIVAALLTVPAGLARLARFRRWTRTASDAAVAHAAWEELRAGALDFGLPWRQGDSPRVAARRLAQARPLDEAATRALARLVTAEERARYAPVPGPAHGLRADVRVVREAFARTTTRRARWRARLLPPSSTLVIRRAGAALLDAFDRLDSLTLRWRRRASG